MKLRLAFAVALGVSGIVLACGTGSGGSSGGSGGSDSQSFISEICSLYAPCCAKVNKPTDGATCRAIYGALAGAALYDAAKGSACLGELRARSSQPDFCDSPGSQSASCGAVFRESGGGGTKQPGEDCTSDGDCASSAEGSVNCASSYNGNGAATRSCQVEVDGKEGDTPCVGTRDGNTTSSSSSSISGDAGPTRPAAKGYICDVAKGVYCSSKTKACVAIHQVGGTCEGFDQYACVKTAFCSYSTKQCQARRAVGEDCATESQSCVANANCDTQTRKCIIGLAEGTACTTGPQCASRSCVNGKCGSSGGGSGLLCGGN